MRKDIDDLSCQMEEICRFCCPPEKERILYITEHFYVMVSLGPIVEGYLLIVSKEHIGACLHLPEEYIEEFLRLKNKVKQILTDEYGGCIFYEHGKVGSCLIEGKDHIHCFHAHLHCIPALLELNEDIEKELNGNSYESFYDCYNGMRGKDRYLYIEDSKIMTYCPERKLRSQYLRYKLAEKAGEPERWDWVKMQNWPLIEKSIERLKPRFNESAGEV